APADNMEFAMDEYVVTASRTQTAKVDTPANVTTIDAEKIESRRYQDVAEVIKDIPGAAVMDTGSGAYEKAIVLNGDSRVLVMVDGRRLEMASGGVSGRASYDMGLLPDVSNIERIEVLKGAGGALYGSDAVGGVINIITKKVDHTSGKVSMAFGSNQTRDAKAMYSIREGKTSISVNASKYKQGYYKYKDVADKATKRWPENSSMDGEKVALKITQDFNDKSNIEFGYEFDKYDGFSSGTMYNYYGNSKNSKKAYNFYTKLNWTINSSDEGYIQIYRNQYNYLSTSTANGTLWGDVDEKTFGVDLQQALKTADNNTLVIGASWRESSIENLQDDSWTGARIGYSEDLSNKAIFINDTWEFIPSWTLNAGVRYDDHNYAGDKTTMSAGLNKKFDEASHAYVNWGQVFKAPTGTDLFDPMMGNRYLKPEKGDTWTVGYGTKLNDKTDVNISYFQSDLEDAISWASDGDDMWYSSNVAKQKKKGLELSVSHELNDNWDLEASYTYVKVRDDMNDGEGFVRDINYAPNTYRLGARYHNEKWNASVTLRAANGLDTRRVSKSTYENAFVDGSYITMDMAVSYKPDKAWNIFAKGYNLFNKAYAERAGVYYNGSYEYPAQSRRFIVGAEYSF
ncbi:MAG: TonB-dependent receptor, partial [Phascolarctobacterium sp.]|nr:TonB-dependent receptor [Phascolarctobacterium sp.]